MEWKRCSKCKGLKTVDNFYRKYDGYTSWCKECIKERDLKNKEKKKEYDKKRKRKKDKKIEIVCMRCDKYLANVKNNKLYWCFYCLEKYQKELKVEIPVVIIRKSIRKA